MRAAGRLAALALSLASAPAMAATITGTVELVIVEPFTIVKLQDLEFGSVLPSAAAGTVTINPNTLARTTAGGVTAAPGGHNPAEFITRGSPGRRVLVRLPTGTVTLARIGGGATMTVSNFTRNGAPPTSTPLDAAGYLTFRVGGRLNVGANQLPGRYTGSFTVEVQYQ
jgi:Domain of unknown function (DUF4402)